MASARSWPSTGGDGRLFLLDARSLGGRDHRTPLHVTARGRRRRAPSAGPRHLGGRHDPLGPGARWDTSRRFKVSGDGGTLQAERAWQSRPLVSPLAPIVVNGVVFAASSGEFRGGDPSMTAKERAERSTPAVLYALDGATGKELWTSGTTITSFARGGLSAGGGQVYVVTFDNTLYAFGIPMEH